MKCNKCKKEKDISEFNDGKCKTCSECREHSKKWRQENKERVSEYNKFSVNKRNNVDKIIKVVYARKYNTDDEWMRFGSQRQAAKQLNLDAPNVNSVVKGHMKQTGGYEFKIEEEKKKAKEETKTWEEIKEKNGYEEKIKGCPSNNRTLHETKDGIPGKKCCTCKEWKPLIEYNFDKNHWDELRVECKKCLEKWRRENRSALTKYHKNYEANRKNVDENLKMLKKLRSRLKQKLFIKSERFLYEHIELIGCSSEGLQMWIEAKFKDGMTRENHGEWHIDHKIPCSSFDLTNEEEQKKCFHYKNLQPLWAKENMTKGNQRELTENMRNMGLSEREVQ